MAVHRSVILSTVCSSSSTKSGTISGGSRILVVSVKVMNFSTSGRALLSTCSLYSPASLRSTLKSVRPLSDLSLLPSMTYLREFPCKKTLPSRTKPLKFWLERRVYPNFPKKYSVPMSVLSFPCDVRTVKLKIFSLEGLLVSAPR
jgi:hypothetical protein